MGVSFVRWYLSPGRILSLLLFLLLLLVGGQRVRQTLTRTRAEATLVGSDCRDSNLEACTAPEVEAGSPSGIPAPLQLLAAETCSDVGYLCAEVERTGSLRILRWPLETPLIRVWVPEPEHLPPEPGQELQRAAVRGIQAWQGHPFPLSVRTRRTGDPPDITVHWVDTLGESRIGRARIEWVREGDEVHITVLGLDLATRNPSDPNLVLTSRQIQLVAAHEMGHALGLPHSDDPRDVMFPRNSALSLSVRDYRTMEALYALPNGAEIRR